MSTRHTPRRQNRTLPRVNRGLLSGERNARWAGDDVGIDGVHRWVRKLMEEAGLLTGICSICGKKPPMRREALPKMKVRWVSGIDLHSTTGEYTRDTSEYIEICRPCHNKLKKEG